MNSKKPVLRWT